MDVEHQDNQRSSVSSEKRRRRLLMQLADVRDTMGYVREDRRETRKNLLSADRWVQDNPDDLLVREARDRLREALIPRIFAAPVGGRT
jgi:hypothetical protein